MLNNMVELHMLRLRSAKCETTFWIDGWASTHMFLDYHVLGTSNTLGMIGLTQTAVGHCEPGVSDGLQNVVLLAFQHA